METAFKTIIIIVAVIYIPTQVVSCTKCYQAGGVPVQGVFGYACVK